MSSDPLFNSNRGSLALKVIAVIFGLLPLGFIGLFHIFGGPDPGSGGDVHERVLFSLLGVPYCMLAVFWCIPNRILLGWRLGVITATVLSSISVALALPFLIWLHRSDPGASLAGSLFLGLLVLIGLLCAPASYYFAWKANPDFIRKQSDPNKNKWVV